MKTVTVIISTYNGEKYIIRQLESIVNQKNVDVNVVIRDDNSSDNTINIIQEYITQHNYQKKIKIIEGKNVGYAKSFWLALCESGETDFYAFSDQDDIWKTEKLIQCVNCMKEADNIPQLVYCNMQRSDSKLNKLEEQVEIIRPEQLSKKLTLTKTYNYGAATVINKSAKELVCRTWPEIDDLPHDMWVGTLCYWFGQVYYVDSKLYYWIRYETSVTGEGTKKTGIYYRIKKTLKKQSYPNISNTLLEKYSDLLSIEDQKFLKKISNYKKNIKDKIELLIDPEFNRLTFCGTLVLKIGILFNWY